MLFADVSDFINLLRLPQQNTSKQFKTMGKPFSQPGGWKSQIRVPAGLVSGESSLPDLQMAVFSHGEESSLVSLLFFVQTAGVPPL